MAYLTYEEYRKLSPLSSVLEGAFETISSIASDAVDSYTFGAIRDYCLMDDDETAEQVRKAVARQIDFIQSQGGAEAYLSKAEPRPEASYSISMGNTSESKSYASGGYSEGVTAEGFIMSPLACAYLRRIKAIGRQIGRGRRCL